MQLIYKNDKCFCKFFSKGLDSFAFFGQTDLPGYAKLISNVIENGIEKEEAITSWEHESQSSGGAT